MISGEEQFEDYGEGEDVDFTPSSPCPEDETRTNGFSDLGSSLPSRLVNFYSFPAKHFELSLKEKSRMRTIQCYIFKFKCVVLYGVVMLFPHVVVLKGNWRST